MSVTSRDIHSVYGPLAKGGSRFPTPAAELAGQVLTSVMPILTPAAARVCAQHLHHVSRHAPHKGTREAIHSMVHDFGLRPAPIHGPEDMVAAFHEDAPLTVFLGGARRHTRHEPKTKKEHARRAAHYARGGIEEDLRFAVTRHGKQPTKKELEEMKRDLARLGGAMEGGALMEGGGLMEDPEGAGFFSNLAMGLVKRHPLVQLGTAAAQSRHGRALGRLVKKHVFFGGAEEGGMRPQTAKDREDESRAMKKWWAEHRKSCRGHGCECGGAREGGRRRPHEGVGFAEEDIEAALKKHHGKLTKKEKEQIVRDLKKYGVGAPGPVRHVKSGHSRREGVRKGTLYEAFRR